MEKRDNLKLKVRESNIHDGTFVREALVSLLSELRNAPVEISEQRFHENYKQILDQHNPDEIIIAEDGDKPIGMVSLSVFTALHCGACAMIQELWVEPGYRNAGVGKMLMEEAERYCVKHKIGRIDVGLPGSSFQDFAKTNQFYETCGFEDVGVRKKKVIKCTN